MQLYNGDCLEVIKNIPDNSIDLVVTDPPYEVSATNGGGSINNMKNLNKSLKQLDEANITTGYDVAAVCKEIVRVMKNINIYIWCNKVQIPEYIHFFVDNLNCKFEILCWHKTNALPTYNNKYLTDTEYCLYFRKNGYCDPSKTKESERYENAKTFYIAPINHKDKKTWKHPTIKPLGFIEKVIKNSSKEGDIVLDCFMGSGTTGVACKNLNRNFIGIELNENYFKIAKERIENTEKEKEYNLFNEVNNA